VNGIIGAMTGIRRESYILAEGGWDHHLEPARIIEASYPGHSLIGLPHETACLAFRVFGVQRIAETNLYVLVACGCLEKLGVTNK